MSWLDDAGNWLTNPQVAGVFGSLLSLRWAPGKDWRDKVFSFGCGVACTAYLAPAAVDYMGLAAKWAPPLFGFLAGLLGMNIVAKLVSFVRDTDWPGTIAAVKDIAAALKAWRTPK